ncbi:MAG: ribosome silencing factor [Acidobacteria bacterium]|nr:MAG: ribosome silencing factor [Acidobacteriota bacterium]
MKENSTAKEQSLNPQPAVNIESHQTVSADQLDERLLSALNAAAEKKALDVVVLDLREIASFTDFFVIATGANERQVQAISDEVYETLKKSGSTAARVEGYKTAEWVLLDYGDFVFHVFEQKARQFYDLERLWRESKRVDLPPEIVGTSSLRRDS